MFGGKERKRSQREGQGELEREPCFESVCRAAARVDAAQVPHPCKHFIEYSSWIDQCVTAFDLLLPSHTEATPSLHDNALRRWCHSLPPVGTRSSFVLHQALPPLDFITFNTLAPLFSSASHRIKHLHLLHIHTPNHSISPPANMSGKSGKASGDAAKTAQSRSSKAGLQFPVGRIHRMLRKGNYATRIGAGAPGESALMLLHR